MSMLSRYKKSGGFKQLLNLIETCGAAKQEKFLTMIEAEDPRWAKALKQKMLSLEKIFNWNDMVLAEIAVRLQELTLATALHGLSPEQNQRLMKTFSHSQRRKIDDIFNTKKPSPGEISTMFMKIIEQVRGLISDGYIRVQEFDPEMVIESDIEDMLSKEAMTIIDSPEPGETALNFGALDTTDTTGELAGKGDGPKDVEQMKLRLVSLANENKRLKVQLRTLQEKLEQIKRIA